MSTLDKILEGLSSGILDTKSVSSRESIYKKIIISLVETFHSALSYEEMRDEISKAKEILTQVDPEKTILSKVDKEILSALKNLGDDAKHALRVLRHVHELGVPQNFEEMLTAVLRVKDKVI